MKKKVIHTKIPGKVVIYTSGIRASIIYVSDDGQFESPDKFMVIAYEEESAYNNIQTKKIQINKDNKTIVHKLINETEKEIFAKRHNWYANAFCKDYPINKWFFIEETMGADYENTYADIIILEDYIIYKSEEINKFKQFLEEN